MSRVTCRVSCHVSCVIGCTNQTLFFTHCPGPMFARFARLSCIVSFRVSCIINTMSCFIYCSACMSFHVPRVIDCKAKHYFLHLVPAANWSLRSLIAFPSTRFPLYWAENPSAPKPCSHDASKLETFKSFSHVRQNISMLNLLCKIAHDLTRSAFCYVT